MRRRQSRFVVMTQPLASPLWLAVVVALALMVPATGLAQDRNFATGNEAIKACQKLYADKDYAGAAKAYEDFTKLYRGHPQRDQAFYQATLSFINAKQWDAALRTAKAHVQAYPATATSQNSIRQLAQAYYNEKEYEKAADLLTQLIADPAYSDRYGAWSLLLTSYSQAKKFDKVVETCDQFVARHPAPAARASEILLRKMDALAAMERFIDLEGVAQQIDALTPATYYSAAAWEKVGSAEAARLQRYANASAAYRKAAQTPGYLNADNCMRMACSALEQGKTPDYKAAAAAYEEFIKSFAGSVYEIQGRLRLAWLYGTQLKNNEEELRVRKEFDRLYGKTVSAPENLSGLMALGQRDKAFLGEARKAAVRLAEEFGEHPATESALLWLADIYKRNDDRARAKTYATQLVENFPCGPNVERAQQMLKELK